MVAELVEEGGSDFVFDMDFCVVGFEAAGEFDDAVSEEVDCFWDVDGVIDGAFGEHATCVQAAEVGEIVIGEFEFFLERREEGVFGLILDDERDFVEGADEVCWERVIDAIEEGVEAFALLVRECHAVRALCDERTRMRTVEDIRRREGCWR